MHRCHPDRAPRLRFVIGALVAAGCANGAPRLEPLADQVAIVETELTLALRATDPEGDAISFSYTVADLGDISDRAHIEATGVGEATFRFTPIISDVGQHVFDFVARATGGAARATIVIEVKTADQAGAPIFRQPLGTGTTLDLAQKSCLDVAIVVEDPDTAEVDITQEPPVIAGATLSQTDGLTAAWSWCPTADEIAAADRYLLTLAASDGTSTTQKPYLIVLLKPAKPDCPGTAPVVTLTATPAGDTTIMPIDIFALVSDDLGLKAAPLLYYTTDPPADPPDLSRMAQVTMLQIDGDLTSGSWGGEMPNPVATAAAGTVATIYYVILAQDHDDPSGDCDHVTQAPATGTFTFVVTAGDGSETGRALCEACTADVQCGGAADNCVVLGSGGESFCGTACSADPDCAAGYACSPTALESVDHSVARQCVPQSGSCGPSQCADDAFEPDDNDAEARQVDLSLGRYVMTTNAICSGNDDWYHLPLKSHQTVHATVAFTQTTAAEDLDIRFYFADPTAGLTDLTNCTETNLGGCSATNGQSSTSNENYVREAGVTGDYYLVVHGWNGSANLYDICLGLSNAASTGCPALAK